MPTYSAADIELIADAISTELHHVIQYRNRLEAAAAWYRADSRAPRRVAPSTIKLRASSIVAAARKLQRLLGDCREAAEKPKDLALLNALVSAEDENDVAQARERVRRLADIFDAIDAAQDLECWGRRVAADAATIGRLTTLRGRRGDYAMNAWIAELMGIYKCLTGKEPRISRTASGPLRGRPTGPFFRFLEAASKPVECGGKPLRLKAIPERVRSIRAGALRTK